MKEQNWWLVREKMPLGEFMKTKVLLRHLCILVRLRNRKSKIQRTCRKGLVKTTQQGLARSDSAVPKRMRPSTIRPKKKKKKKKKKDEVSEGLEKKCCSVSGGKR